MGNDQPAGMELWASTAWRESTTAWVDARLAEFGRARSGEPEQVRLRPWGTVLRIPSAAGPVWFKAPAPATVFEVGLYDLLARQAPDCVLAPLATDLDRGWLLLPDGGLELADTASGEGLVDALASVLTRYGRLQRDLAPEVDALLALGLADMRAAAMPARFDEAFAAVDAWVAGYGNAVDRDLVRRIAARRETFAIWCDRLEASPGAPGIDYNDLHPKNIFVTATDPSPGIAIADWGDAVIAHPFASLLVALGFVRHHLKVSTTDPAVLRVRDAYLDAFVDLAPRADLVATADLACQVAKVTRALVWHRSLQGSQPDELDPAFGREPLVWLAGILNDDPLATGS